MDPSDSDPASSSGGRRIGRTEVVAATFLLIAVAMLFVPVSADLDDAGRVSCGSIIRPSTVASRAGTRRELCEQIGAYQDRMILVLVIAGIGGVAALSFKLLDRRA